MPFMLYDVVGKDGYRQYMYLKNVQIAGNTGPLAAIEKNSNGARPSPFGWHASASDIVAAIPGTTAGQEILIDLKPNVSENVSLYRLTDVWGFSYDDWTPLALLLQTLFAD